MDRAEKEQNGPSQKQIVDQTGSKAAVKLEPETGDTDRSEPLDSQPQGEPQVAQTQGEDHDSNVDDSALLPPQQQQNSAFQLNPLDPRFKNLGLRVTSCVRCYEKKIKCSKERPSCDHCSKKGAKFDCVYTRNVDGTEVVGWIERNNERRKLEGETTPFPDERWKRMIASAEKKNQRAQAKPKPPKGQPRQFPDETLQIQRQLQARPQLPFNQMHHPPPPPPQYYYGTHHPQFASPYAHPQNPQFVPPYAHPQMRPPPPAPPAPPHGLTHDAHLAEIVPQLNRLIDELLNNQGLEQNALRVSQLRDYLNAIIARLLPSPAPRDEPNGDGTDIGDKSVTNFPHDEGNDAKAADGKAKKTEDPKGEKQMVPSVSIRDAKAADNKRDHAELGEGRGKQEDVPGENFVSVEGSGGDAKNGDGKGKKKEDGAKDKQKTVGGPSVSAQKRKGQEPVSNSPTTAKPKHRQKQQPTNPKESSSNSPYHPRPPYPQYPPLDSRYPPYPPPPPQPQPPSPWQHYDTSYQARRDFSEYPHYGSFMRPPPPPPSPYSGMYPPEPPYHYGPEYHSHGQPSSQSQLQNFPPNYYRPPPPPLHSLPNTFYGNGYYGPLGKDNHSKDEADESSEESISVSENESNKRQKTARRARKFDGIEQDLGALPAKNEEDENDEDDDGGNSASTVNGGSSRRDRPTLLVTMNEVEEEDLNDDE